MNFVPKGYVLSSLVKITKALSLSPWSIRKKTLLEMTNNATQVPFAFESYLQLELIFFGAVK